MPRLALPWAVLGLVFAPATAPADWPHPRGPTYDAVAPDTGLADHWPPAGPFAVAAARAERGWVRWAADGLGFVAYFWASGLLPGWKERWAG